VIPLLAAYFFVVSILTVSVPRLRAPDDALMIIAVGVLASQLWQWRSAAAEPAPASPDAQGVIGVLD
jgi:hypothetical protein